MDPRAPRHAAIVGGGNMGADIALLFAAGGWRVHVVEPSEAARAALPARFARGLAQLHATAAIGRLQAHAALESVPWPDVDIAVECIPEELEAKRALFARLERLARTDTVLASNSSAFPIGAIGAGLATRERMAGLHFFLPAHLVPLVEVIRSERTRAGLPEELGELVRALGKVPVQVRKDVPGFLANRLQHAMAREAYALIDAGVATPEDVDAAVRFGFGLRFLAAGPCLQRDHAGLEVHAAAAATMYPTLANDTVPSATLTGRVARGELGMKSGKGFYEWDAESIRREKERYEARLLAALALLKEDM
ncbi:MAG TPA: 3-hydroxyacyl-CoA dehydrogenase NAD-binding domain-containing protein [Myxococcota bacterium]|nr:3-hydroxyacyl-CoA dehydrogenase NAD-binding domain-containing protein [Myxococcota bacterium]